MVKTIFRTVLGDVPADKIGSILPHEHLFTDLRGPDVDGYAQEDPDLVVSTMLPYLKAAEAAGVTALVECSTVGVGRNIAILSRLAACTRIHIIAPTGIYKESYTPILDKGKTVTQLVDQWTAELTQGIGFTTNKAGFIKVALSDDGPTPLEERNLRATAQTSLATGAAIASHTIGGEAAVKEMAILRAEGLDLAKFIWVHASSEPDPRYHFKAAAEGAFVEFDNIGQPGVNPERLADQVLALVQAGGGERVLLSHDAGWYQPGTPGGMPEGGMRGYTALSSDFIPLLREKGLDEAAIRMLTEENPKRAFSLREE